MKEKTRNKLILIALFLVLIAVAQPLVSMSVDDFGIAVSTRQSEQYKFHPLFIWEW